MAGLSVAVLAQEARVYWYRGQKGNVTFTMRMIAPAIVEHLGIPVHERIYGGSMAEFLKTVEAWDLPANQAGFQYAASYMQRLSTQTYFATAVQIPCIFGGKEGCIVAVSTAASTGRMQYNMRQEAASQIIVEPHWMLYDVWWFEGLTPFNFVGISMAAFQGMQVPGNLGALVESLCFERGIAGWREKYLVCLHHECPAGDTMPPETHAHDG